jgi:glycosyltransferase involved in cell wall biosynthesis
MRIGLNLLHAMPEIGGGWNYIDNVVRTLARYDDTNTYIAYVSRESQALLPDKHNMHGYHVQINAKNRIERIACENTTLQRLAKLHRLDCIHWFGNVQAPFSRVPSVVTVHDLIVYNDPGSVPLLKRLYLRSMFRNTVHNCRVLLPISQATARDLEVRLGADREKMIITPFPLCEEFKRMPSSCIGEFRAKHELPERFWLYVAHTYKHKNHCRLLEAYSNLKIAGLKPWPLVLRGDPKDNDAQVMNTIQKLKLKDDVIRLPRLDYFELPLLYSCASALVFPSLHEGCGIPILEAMACGCPVLVSDLPPTREFAGQAACFFDGNDVHDIERCMAKVERDEDFRDALIEKGLAQADRFDASTVARDIVRAYEIAVGLT